METVHPICNFLQLVQMQSPGDASVVDPPMTPPVHYRPVQKFSHTFLIVRYVFPRQEGVGSFDADVNNVAVILHTFHASA